MSGSLTMHAPITKFDVKGAKSIESDLDGWKKIDGNPTMKTWIEYTSADGAMISGWWSATPGTYHATYAAPEYVHMIEGEITITPDGGRPVKNRSRRRLRGRVGLLRDMGHREGSVQALHHQVEVAATGAAPSYDRRRHAPD